MGPGPTWNLTNGEVHIGKNFQVKHFDPQIFFSANRLKRPKKSFSVKSEHFQFLTYPILGVRLPWGQNA